MVLCSEESHEEGQHRVQQYCHLGTSCDRTAAWALSRSCWMSTAAPVVVPVMLPPGNGR